MFISPFTSDDSTYPAANQSFDGVLQVDAPLPHGFWIQLAATSRRGYHYLTIVCTSDEPVTFSNMSCAISFAPGLQTVRANCSKAVRLLEGKVSSLVYLSVWRI